MALKSKATIKTQLDAIAAALTLVCADTVSGVAVQAKHPMNPIRRVTDLFDIDATGTVTVNASAWDSLWNAGGTELVKNTAKPSGSFNKKILA